MRKIGLYFLMLVLGIISFSMVVCADTTLPDGTVINRYTNWSGVPSSYSGLEYYDVLVPYTKKISEIGGQSLGGKAGTEYANRNVMESRLASYFVGDYVSLENKIPNDVRYTLGGEELTVVDAGGLNIAKDGYENEYYLIALGHYFYPGEASSNGFYPFSTANRGQLVDVVLTDGTVIHCLIGDAKADVHTNGGDGPSHKADESSNYAYYYRFANLEYPEGQNLFQAQNSEVLEIFADSTGLGQFKSLFNLNCTSRSNHIAFIRFYKGTFFNSGNLRSESVGKSTSYNLGAVTFERGTPSEGMGSASLSLTGSSLVDEWDIVGMPVRNDLTKNQMAIVLLGRDSLSLNESDIVDTMGDNIYLLKQSNLLDFVRTVTIFVGLIILLYAFLLGLGMLFDRANTFFDFSIITLLTFGKAKYDPVEEVNGVLPKGYVSTKKLVIVLIITTIVGMLLVSSGMTKIIGKLLFLITKYFS